MSRTTMRPLMKGTVLKSKSMAIGLSRNCHCEYRDQDDAFGTVVV